jgi:hemolysin III
MKFRVREPMNGLTHFVGVLFAPFALYFLLNRPFGGHGGLYTISFVIFGVSLFLLYTFSTLYHWLPLSGKKLELFRKIDHIMIFVFISATYTPICLITMNGIWGWSILGTVWGLTFIGLFIKIFWLNAPRVLYTGIYLLMGWIIVIAILPLSQAFSKGGLFWLAAGGLFYSIGAVIYAFKKPDPLPKIFGFHEIFHIFILLGSLSHFIMIYYYV